MSGKRENIIIENVTAFEALKIEETDFVKETGSSKPKERTGKQEVINIKLVATLDKCIVSDHHAFYSAGLPETVTLH